MAWLDLEPVGEDDTNSYWVGNVSDKSLGIIQASCLESVPSVPRPVVVLSGTPVARFLQRAAMLALQALY